MLGPEHPDCFSTRYGLTKTLFEQGLPPKRAEALELARHDVALTALNNLATTLSRLDQRKEAIEIYRRVVALEEELFGSDHVDTLASKHNLGSALLIDGEYAAAIPTLEEVIETGASVLGPIHPKLLSTQAYLGDCYSNLGQLDEAIEIYTRLVSSSREALYGVTFND